MAMSSPSASTSIRIDRCGDADQPDDADRFTPLLGAHHHQRQQKGGAAQDRHGRDGDVKTLEHGERIRPVSRANGRADEHSRARDATAAA